MDLIRGILPANVFETLDRAGICTAKQIMILPIWDIKKLTGLPKDDICLLKRIVARHTSPDSVTCVKLLDCKETIGSGCIAVDNLLNGGFRRGVLIEVYGESGSGKTQLAMQFAAKNAADGIVYICTEDLFPITRYNQIHEGINQHLHILCNNVFVEHVYESQEMLACIRVRLPKLLQQHKVSIIVIDSVAAPFRCETTNYIQRAEELRELAIMLIKIAQEYNLAVLCINQVTSKINGPPNPLPSLGLAWSNMISYRLCLKKTSVYKNIEKTKENVFVRELTVVFAPDLPNVSCNFLITTKGIIDM